MKITKLEAFPLSIRYKRKEVSALIAREGVSDVIVKLTADNGLVGWGEACMNSETIGIQKAVEAAAPFVVGRDPVGQRGHRARLLHRRRLAVPADDRELRLRRHRHGDVGPDGQGSGPADLPHVRRRAARVGALFLLSALGYARGCGRPMRRRRQRGYDTYYFKVGVDTAREESLLEIIRERIGKDRFLRVDANQAWTVPQAVKTIERWHRLFDLDFVEGPVPVEPIDLTLEVKSRITPPICVNEGLWKHSDAMRLIRSRAGNYLCFSPYWVGSLRRFSTLAHVAHHEGQIVCKHTHGEFGLAAAAGQHMMLASPNADHGNQQTAQMMEDDILTERIPIMDGPEWGRIEGPGLGVEVDEDKVARYHEAFLRDGEFTPYGDRFSRAPMR